MRRRSGSDCDDDRSRERDGEMTEKKENVKKICDVLFKEGRRYIVGVKKSLGHFKLNEKSGTYERLFI